MTREESVVLEYRADPCLQLNESIALFVVLGFLPNSATAGKGFVLTDEQLNSAVDFLDPNQDGNVSRGRQCQKVVESLSRDGGGGEVEDCLLAQRKSMNIINNTQTQLLFKK